LAKSKSKKNKSFIETEIEPVSKKAEIQEEDVLDNDPLLEKITLIFLITFLLLVIFIPGDWFNTLSMWVRSHTPGLK
jgi:hypothetical protein